ncbi:hypothetical protein Salat_2209800 [Sesamum alatum]|uniref:Uncharacterized protein n=1 Tax=Sesamum alatum TaxID=300844 RepID=A0AAE1XTW9_9LAMI|nr:hypothetical protein Salat_2209800 [Sesamum alatum]
MCPSNCTWAEASSSASVLQDWRCRVEGSGVQGSGLRGQGSANSRTSAARYSKDGGKVHRSSGTNTLGIFAGLEKTGYTTNRKLEARLAASRLSFLGRSQSECLAPTCLLNLPELAIKRKRDCVFLLTQNRPTSKK